MKKIIILSVFVYTCSACFSQINTIGNYLDDKGRTEAKNIIKTNITEILQANIPIIWEHRFNDNIALQSGVGWLTYNFFKPIIRPDEINYPLNEHIVGGVSLYLQPIYYLINFESIYTGISFQYKQYGNQASSIEYALCLGKQWLLGRHLAADIEVGIGANYEYSLDGQSYIYNPKILDTELAQSFRMRSTFLISLKLGYVI